MQKALKVSIYIYIIYIIYTLYIHITFLTGSLKMVILYHIHHDVHELSQSHYGNSCGRAQCFPGHTCVYPILFL